MEEPHHHPPPRNRSPRWWIGIVAAVAWCSFIAATSSTVILPHDFFAWLARHLLTEQASYRRFVVFWGCSWFVIVKGWHAAEFAILFALCLAIVDRITGSCSRRNVLLCLSICLLFAISDEYHQTFVPKRGGTWTDVAIDGLGALLAAFFPWRQRGSPSHLQNESITPVDS
ncbi:MAG: VanZ family protein [Isosphaeraceae bacterium]